MQNNQFELSVLVGGKKIPEYGHQGRTLVEGRKGVNYTLKFKNNSAHRVLVVPSIDGMSVIDGKPVAEDSHCGYVVEPYSSADIDGWRTSLNDVARFVFSGKPDSYSEESGQGVESCGVIACRMWSEKEKFEFKPVKIEEHHHHHHHHEDHWYPKYPFSPAPMWCNNTGGVSGKSVGEAVSTYSSTNDPVKSVSSMMSCSVQTSAPNESKSVLRGMSMESKASPDFNLGTGWGTQDQSRVTTTKFTVASCIGAMEIYYTDLDGLAKIGIEVNKDAKISTSEWPNAYPGFCRPPKRS